MTEQGMPRDEDGRVKAGQNDWPVRQYVKASETGD
jgi:hypothetical protein